MIYQIPSYRRPACADWSPAPVSDAAARADIAAAWGVNSLPTTPGRTSTQIIDSLASGELDAVVVGGVDVHDLPAGRKALDTFKKSFVISLEIAPSAITAVADVVLPVAAITEKSGSFLNWEGRARAFDEAVIDSHHRSDVRILSMIADAMGESIMLGTVTAAAREFNQLGKWDGAKAVKPIHSSSTQNASGNQAILQSWRQLIDLGSLQSGEENLAGTARKAVAVISSQRAASLGVSEGDVIKISSDRGSIELPAHIAAISEESVWIPRNSQGSQAIVALGAASGILVTVVKA